MPDNVRKVVVKVTTKDGKDDGAVPTYVEVDRGAGHIRVSGRDLVANKEEATFELRPGERLVVEGFTEEAVAYDREQAAAFSPSTQRNAEGKTDAPTGKPAEQTSQTGASPSETQDSRTKSSPGSLVTPAMAASNQREQENQKLADQASKRSAEQQAAGGSKAAQGHNAPVPKAPGPTGATKK